MECMLKELNTFLSNLNVFYRKLQNYHWNIIGKDFFVIHSKLEEYYDKINEQIDEIAEHILMLKGEPLGTMKDYLENTSIQEARNEKVKDCEVFNAIIKDYGTLLQNVTTIKKKAEEQTDYLTSSLMDNYILDYTKILWMLNQMMQS